MQLSRYQHIGQVQIAITHQRGLKHHCVEFSGTYLYDPSANGMLTCRRGYVW